jgi:hypothetical protein
MQIRRYCPTFFYDVTRIAMLMVTNGFFVFNEFQNQQTKYDFMIIKCSECGKEISNKAKFCVNCGCPIEDKYNQSGKDMEEYLPEQTERVEVSTLKTVATIILICGIILAIILFIAGALKTNFWGVWTGLNTVLGAVGVVLLTIAIWAWLRASANASSDIRKINDKLED